MRSYTYFSQFFIILCLTACSTYKAKVYHFPDPVDTKIQPTEIQVKKTYAFEKQGIYVDNQFDGARLNDFIMVNDSSFQALIKPENAPINPSPWYSFRIRSNEKKNINITLVYSLHSHRYFPKSSTDGKTWEPIDSATVQINPEKTQFTFQIPVSKEPIWISAQELHTSNDVSAWCTNLAKTEGVEFQSIGKSKLGRDLFNLDIGRGEKEGKEIIAILSRQHPPEVTGYLAMQPFVEEIINGEYSKDFLDKYRVLVYPLLNPDGVDLGHWRHNTGGVDMNRDWAYYHQPEIRKISNNIVKESKKNSSQVILGLDFHSTYHDVYYTNAVDSIKSVIPWFNKAWFDGIEKNLEGYKVNESPAGIGKPTSKGWFYTQFNAEGITYEIGDDTPRDFIKIKGQTSAKEMMRLLLEHSKK